jgi:hypothetical protein
MNRYIGFIFFVLSFNSFSQDLKTFNGPFVDGKIQNGNATYTYYEDPITREYLKHGNFQYTFNGKAEYQGYDQTIKGSFEKGLKHGKWIYQITMTDFGSGNPYYTGTVTLVANYKNGYAHGNWKEVRSYKTRNRYLNYGQLVWESFGPIKTMTAELNFNNGYLVNTVYINDEFAKFKVTGSFDNNGLAVGTWYINDIGWNQNKELIYKDHFLYEVIVRNNAGEIVGDPFTNKKNYEELVKLKSMSSLEMEELGISIDPVCGSANHATAAIEKYFPKILNNDYYLYSFIKGDLTHKEGIKGGCEIRKQLVTYAKLENLQGYVDAEFAFKLEDYYKARKLYLKINLDKIKPSDRKKINDRLSEIEQLIK